MRKSRLIKNFIAIVLLIALTQKVGFGIFYHNWQHTKSCIPVSQTSPSFTNASCNCIDDFLMPFTGSSIEVTTVAPLSYSVFVSPQLQYSSTFYQCFHALRAPPCKA